MKTNVMSVDGKKKTEIELPIQFSEPVRLDLIKRAVLASQSKQYQPYGADPRAGTKQGDATPKRRRKYRTTYGSGMSRIKRKTMWHRGTRFARMGAFVANAVGGRKAFPPIAEKIIIEKINKKENRKAIRSALAATSVRELVEARNHQVADIKSLPLVVEDKLEDLKKTKEVKDALVKLGLKTELDRVTQKKVRAGRGTTRGRKYSTKKGPLIVVGKSCALEKSAKNLPGADIVQVKNLNAELLAPGTHAGRLTVFTKSSLELMQKEGMFK